MELDGPSSKSDGIDYFSLMDSNRDGIVVADEADVFMEMVSDPQKFANKFKQDMEESLKEAGQYGDSEEVEAEDMDGDHDEL